MKLANGVCPICGGRRSKGGHENCSQQTAAEHKKTQHRKPVKGRSLADLADYMARSEK